MPGTIRVSVLEAVDLPEVVTDGAVGKDVTAKVTLGPKLFKTQPGVADGGKIASWNSDFVFPVMNLRDKLEISICDSEDHSMTQTAIEIPSIIQKGSRDEFVALNEGGRIHLRMSFILTEEERKKIETMRVAALKRKEEAAQRLKKTKTVILQPVTPEKDQWKKPPVSTVAIAEVDVSTTDDTAIAGDATKTATGAKDSTMDSPTPGHKKTSTPKPKPMFNYAKAVGAPPSAKKTVKKVPSAAVADSSTDELKTDTGDAPRVEENTSESTRLAPSPETAAPVTSTTPKVAVNAESENNFAPGEVVEVPRNAELVTEAVNNITPGEVVEVPRNAELVREALFFNITPGEVVEEPRNAESVRKAVDNITPGEVVEVPRNAGLMSSSTAEEKVEVPRSAAPVEVDTSNLQDFSWGDEFKATKSSSGNTGDGAEIKAAPSPNHEAEVRHVSGELDSSSLMMVSEERIAFSGPLTSMSRTVKASVKRTLSRVSSMRTSTALTRSPSLVQEVLRRAVSNVKGCYGFNAAAVHR